ncbi:envelope stress response membrane protein PspB [Sphingomicrobium sediminis]|uniref:Envelope stress response membrane protein PspB n=1 Tax=Sphingomicrobium sediminis TaxID=2950949 RepID=A0A9X2EFA5_9SPHN|nr:envelope stress response membrane protein PspB [Sphingomicrobium sediminis]MCM8556918.1 envelope stress response membrane protein PspB [Sphingomicrobium sediminis]
MGDEFIGFFAIFAIFIGLPWLIFHYVTKWKSQTSLTEPDERLLDELHDLARRLDDRIQTIERIMSAEDPDWKRRSIAYNPVDDRDESLLGRADDLLAEHEALLSRRKEK